MLQEYPRENYIKAGIAQCLITTIVIIYPVYWPEIRITNWPGQDVALLPDALQKTETGRRI